jgi:hypothetical protein
MNQKGKLFKVLNLRISVHIEYYVDVLNLRISVHIEYYVDAHIYGFQ